MTITARLVRAAVPAVLALLSACALNGGRPGAAADPDRITLEEITASGATNAYEVVQRLRPAWLRQRIDHRTTGLDLQTLVMHNGTRFGYLGSLRDLPAEMIGSMRFMEGSAAQAVLTGTDKEIGAVIEVSSHALAEFDAQRETEARGASFAGVAVSVFPLGYATRERPTTGHDLMLRDGWTMTRNTPASTGSLMAAVEVGATRAVTVGFLAGRQTGTEEEAYARGEGTGGVAFSHTSTTMAAVFGYRVGPVRLAAGPALQVSTLTAGVGDCGCLARESRTSYLRGGVVEGLAQLRVMRVLTGELRVQRYFLPERSVPTYDHTAEYHFSRARWFVGVGAGLRVGR